MMGYFSCRSEEDISTSSMFLLMELVSLPASGKTRVVKTIRFSEEYIHRKCNP